MFLNFVTQDALTPAPNHQILNSHNQAITKIRKTELQHNAAKYIMVKVSSINVFCTCKVQLGSEYESVVYFIM